MVVAFHSESFIKQPFGLDFSIFQKTSFIIKILCIYILPHFDVDFHIPLLKKYNHLGSMVILLTVEVQCITLIYHHRNLSFIICNINPSSPRTLSRWRATRSYTTSMRLAFNSGRVTQECEKNHSANIRSFFLKKL